jgi:hypothetical protein
MGRGEGTLGRSGKGGAGAGSTAVADNALRNKVKTLEEQDEARKLARAAERDLQERLQRELEQAKLNALLVQETWRKLMRTMKVRRRSRSFARKRSFRGPSCYPGSRRRACAPH